MLSKRQRLIYVLPIITMGIACEAWFAWSLFPSMLKSYQAQVSDQPPTSGEEFIAASGTFDDEHLTIEGLEIVGEPLEVKRSSLDFSDFVLVQSTNALKNGMPEVVGPDKSSEEAVVILDHREKVDQSIADMIREGQLKGSFCAHEGDLSPKNTRALQQHFPNLDLTSTRFVRYQRPLPVWLFWSVCVMFGIQPFSMAWLLYTIVFKQNKLLNGEDWEQKINDDRTKSYRSSQKAMRLINHETYFNGSLQQRTIDASYDVPATKKTTRRKTKHVSLVIAGILVNCLAVAGISYLQFSSDFFAGFGKMGGQLLMVIPMIIIGVLAKLIRRRVVSREEEELPLAKSKYRELDFYKYHAQVLVELGFVEIGDYRQLGIEGYLVRTIFLSPRGNLLVELGEQNGIPFFTLESLTNSGKLLETHSLIGPKHELVDESKAHLRQSASHLDFVKALEDHDELVSKMTFAGAILEGQFTAENFGRFLAFPFQGKSVS